MKRGDKLIYFNFIEGDSGAPRKLFFVEVESDGRYGCRGLKPKKGDKATVIYDKSKLHKYSAFLFRVLTEWNRNCNMEGAMAKEVKSKLKSETEIVPVLPGLDSDQAETLQKALDRKQHVEYLCYVMLKDLNRKLPLKELAEIAVKKEWSTEEVLREFFGEEEGCCAAEGHTIESLLSLWDESADSMLKAAAGR